MSERLSFSATAPWQGGSGKRGKAAVRDIRLESSPAASRSDLQAFRGDYGENVTRGLQHCHVACVDSNRGGIECAHGERGAG
jgi:hypothetical protein